MKTSTSSTYDSSTVVSASYNYQFKTLAIQFEGATYVYLDVEPVDFDTFNNAESQGIALNEVIKPKYQFNKLSADGTPVPTSTPLAEDPQN
jgi:hypothetical protein